MKFKDILNKTKTEKIESVLTVMKLTIIPALVTGFFLQYYQKLKSFTGTLYWIAGNPINFLLSTFFIFCIYMFMISLLGNLKLSSIICFIAFFALAYSNEQKLNNLGAPLYPVDFYHLQYLKSLFSVTGIHFSLITVIMVIQAAVVLIFFIKKIPKFYLNFIERIPLLILSGLLIYSFTNYSESFMKVVMDKAGITPVLWNQPENYDNNGFVFGMLSNLQNNVMEKPEEYSNEAVERIVEKYKKEADTINKSRKAAEGVKPNVIFLLDETFWDPARLEKAAFSEDPMKNIRKVMSGYSSGYLLSPTFGGDTANVEFETLTGLSMYNIIQGSIPYQQAIDNRDFMPSIVSTLLKENYETAAIHPYDKVFYKRDRVYSILGFESFISQDEIKYKDILGQSYISDQSVVNQILDILKEKDNPAFIHAVTMQNHFPIHEGKFGENSIAVSGLSEANTGELETYSEGIKQSDIAMKNLIDNLSKLKEPTVVVFYGDHLPVLSNSIYEEGGFIKNDVLEKERSFSETPLFVYSNFKLKKMDLKTLSPAFIGPTLFELLNKPVTPYYAMLEDIKAKIPGLKSGVLVDKAGNIKGELSQQELDLLKDYKIIQYDLLVGDQYSLPAMFE